MSNLSDIPEKQAVKGVKASNIYLSRHLAILLRPQEVKVKHNRSYSLVSTMRRPCLILISYQLKIVTLLIFFLFLLGSLNKNYLKDLGMILSALADLE